MIPLSIYEDEATHNLETLRWQERYEGGVEEDRFFNPKEMLLENKQAKRVEMIEDDYKTVISANVENSLSLANASPLLVSCSSLVIEPVRCAAAAEASSGE